MRSCACWPAAAATRPWSSWPRSSTCPSVPLIRRLREEGAHYQLLLDEVRQELACWLLQNTELSVEAVAERLGYRDTSNFSRTFRRWLGMTPNAWRRAAAELPGTPAPGRRQPGAAAWQPVRRLRQGAAGGALSGRSRSGHPPAPADRRLHRPPPAGRAGAGALLAERRRTSGILLDLFFDHCLARDWADYHAEPLPQFTGRVYEVLAAQRELPERLAYIAPRMAQDWLGSYREFAVLEQVIGGMKSALVATAVAGWRDERAGAAVPAAR